MIGTTLGHYQIVDRLGKGGMGEVFVAEDTKLHRRVALKVLPEKFASSASRRERFEREARAVAALDHPNIVTIFSVEEMDGVHFITMQLLEGELLSERIPPKGLEPSELLDIALPLADALTAAHAKGITHRDIKPKNILITRDGTVKVLDFGLAKLEAIEASETEAELETLELTQPGVIMGTASYMSPEQLQGEPIDSRTDIFSLGVVLYEMATGRRPFRGRTPIAVASSILKDKPKPLRELRKELPTELGRIIGQCLEVKAGKRYQSAAQLRADLDAVGRRLDTGSTLLNLGRRLERGERPPLRTLIAGSLAALALVAGLVWTFASGSGRRAVVDSGPKKIVVLPLENLGPESEEYFAAGLTDEITSRLASVSGLRVTSRTSAMQYRGDRPSVEEIGRDLGVDYILAGTVRWSGLDRDDSQVRITPKLVRVADDTQIWAEPYTFEIDDVFSVQTQIAESVVARLGATIRETERASLRERPTENIEAYQAYLEGLYKVQRPDYTLDNLRSAVEDFERAVKLDPDFATAWGELAVTHASIDFYWLDPSRERRAEAERAVGRAQEIAPDASSTQLALANYLYMIDRDYEAALDQLALAERDRSLEVEVLKTRGYVLRRQGSWPEALEALERALELNPVDATAASEVAETHEVVRNFGQALRYYAKSTALDPAQTYSYYSAARAHWLSGAPLTEARSRLEQMPDTTEAVAPLLFWFWQEIYEGRNEAALERLADSSLEQLEYWDGFWPRALLEAQAHRLAGRQAEALEAFETARGVLEAEVALKPWDPRRQSALGLAYAGLGMADPAVEAARRATEIYPLSKDAYSGTIAHLELALVLTMVGDLDGAFVELERLLSIPASVTVALLELDPRWQPVRDDPRFAGLAEAYRQPERL